MINKRLIAVYLQAGLYMAAGIYHFRKPAPYAAIVPAYFGDPFLLVYLSGVAEILLGILLLVRATRKLAGIGLIVLLVAVFPANITMAVNFMHTGNPYTWAAFLRLPLQFLLIWIAWWSTRKSDAVKLKPTEKH